VSPCRCATGNPSERVALRAYTGRVMKTLQAIAVFGFAWAAASSPAYADVQIALDNGRVSLTAKDATVRQILTEWARVGQTKIVNVERIPGGPMTLELRDAPEDQALNLLLRSVAGYVATPRVTTVANSSRFDRIIVMPTAAAPRPAMMASAPPPTFNAPAPQPPPAADDDADDERPASNAPVPTQNPRGPVFNAFPQPQVVNQPPIANPLGMPTASPGVIQQGAPRQATPPAGSVATPGTVAAPGMIAPMPNQPPGQVQPGQPTRRPGGPGGQ
jgi:hypothetical protein